MKPIDAYLLHCGYRSLSSKTIDLYRSKLTVFIGDGPELGSKTRLMELLASVPNSRTRHGYWRAVRSFVKWAASEGLCEDYTAGMRVRQSAAPAPQVLTRADVERILAAIPRSLQGKRDRAMLSLLFFTGCRREAIRGLRRPDIDLTERHIRVTTKGGRQMLVPIATPAADALASWLVRAPASPWVFCSIRHRDKPVDANWIGRMLKRYALAAGFDRRVYCHLLRHSHAHAMAAAKVPIHVIQADLGHSSISTTMNYLRGLQMADMVKGAIDDVFSGSGAR